MTEVGRTWAGIQLHSESIPFIHFSLFIYLLFCCCCGFFAYGGVTNNPNQIKIRVWCVGPATIENILNAVMTKCKSYF